MGRRRERKPNSKSLTMPPSPSHSFSSSSSSDFEFTISISPRKSSTNLCPADELFYKGQLLPLHLSPRLSMVRTLLASSSTSSSSETTTTSSRDSTGSSNDSHSSFTSDLVMLGDCDSSRPSSVTEDDEFKRLSGHSCHSHLSGQIKKNKYFSFSRFSSVFKKEHKNRDSDNGSSVKRASTSAKEVIRKYLKKVRPLYEKLSQKQQQQQQQQKLGGTAATTNLEVQSAPSLTVKAKRSARDAEFSAKSARKESAHGLSHSFSGNLRYPRRRSYVSSCPSSMRSSPSHSGVLTRNGCAAASRGVGMYYTDSWSMEELQSAIQGAIAHCKSSMNKGMVSNEI